MRLILAGTVLILFAAAATEARSEYDPLGVGASKPAFQDFTVEDSARSREIPVRVYLPAETSAAPVVLFSHGLGGSRQGSPYLGEHWAARGYAVVYLQHAGSDEGVWKNLPPRERMDALKKAAGVQNFLLRAKDVPAVLDQLDEWNQTAGHPLAGRLDLSRVGMSGHSFGAITTQAVSGQTFPIGGKFNDKRIKAAVAMSPNAPRQGDVGKAFGSVAIPWMLMTGTRDTSPVGNIDVESRLAVFPALPSGGKYELVLDRAEHSAFSDRPLPGDKEARNPNHHRLVLALSTAFWDVYLKHDQEAKTWLDGDGPAKLLEEHDRWQKK